MISHLEEAKDNPVSKPHRVVVFAFSFDGLNYNTTMMTRFEQTIRAPVHLDRRVQGIHEPNHIAVVREQITCTNTQQT